MIGRALPGRAIPSSLLLAGVVIASGIGLSGCSREPDPESTTPVAGAPYDPVRFDEGLEAIESWLEEGRPVEAERIARRLARLDPDSLDALEAHARCLAILGAFERGSVGDAQVEARRLETLEAYRRLIAAAGDRPVAMHLHAAGLAARSAGETEEALAYHSRAAELEPTNPQHAIFAGNLHAGRGDVESARSWFTRATTIDPREPWGWAGLAEARRQAGERTAALEAIREARRRAPGDDGFRVAEARILREAGRPADSVRLLYAIAPEARATRAITTELTLACAAIGEHGRAAEAWAALHAREPEDHRAALETARAWLAAGEPARAASWLEVAEAAGADPAAIERIRTERSAPDSLEERPDTDD